MGANSNSGRTFWWADAGCPYHKTLDHSLKDSSQRLAEVMLENPPGQMFPPWWILILEAALELKPIGVVRSPVREAIDEGWGDVIAELWLDEDLAAGVRGLDSFSHIVVIYLMHEASFDPAKDLVRRPRGRADMPELGIFAQRARHRPNPIGITVVRLLGVEGTIVRVQGLDAIDGTPVLDIKPYAPVFDAVEGAATPEWLERLM